MFALLKLSLVQSIHDFFADVLGKDWSDYVPDSWKNSCMLRDVLTKGMPQEHPFA